MILNIEVLMNIRALITRYNFMIDDLSVRCELEDSPLDEMIAKGDEDIVDLLNVINDIDKLIGALTEDLRESMQNEGFDWLDYRRFKDTDADYKRRTESIDKYVIDILVGIKKIFENKSEEIVNMCDNIWNDVRSE